MNGKRAFLPGGAEGYLTVFLSLILSVMVSLCLVLILGVRENTRRMEIECVTDIGMNNVLAEYHRELLEQYDLFFIDTTYGTAHASYEQTGARLKEYLEKNLGGDEIFLSVLYRNLVKLQADSVEITRVSAASDEGGAVLRRQAVDVMLGRVGVDDLKQVQNWFTVVKEYELDTRDVAGEQKEAVKALEEWNQTTVTTENGVNNSKIDVPGNEVMASLEKGLLNLVIEDVAGLSGQSVDLSGYLSYRNLLCGTGMNEAAAFEDSFWQQLIFHEYILHYTGQYGAEKSGSLFKYQTEYILAGQNKDTDNLKSIVNRIFAIRAAANMVYLTSDQEKMAAVKALAEILASLVTLPEIAPLIQTVLVLVWAMAESIYDVSALLKGERIPLLKDKGSWHYGLEEILSFQEVSYPASGQEGLSYKDYLRILLCLQDKELTTFRLMDIMEMDIRQTTGNKYFRIDGCIDSLTAIIRYSGKDGKSYSITRNYGY